MAAPPILPLPPREYSDQYMMDFVRVLNLYFNRASSPDVFTSGQLVLSDLPTSSVGLRSGTVWNDGGTLKIVT